MEPSASVHALAMAIAGVCEMNYVLCCKKHGENESQV